MAYSTTKSSKGLPYGDMPYDGYFDKLKISNVVDDDLYNEYARNELSDRNFDKPFLESDRPKSDTSLSRSIINLRYNGRRGTGNNPQHTELFIGELGNDNRGISNDPRLNEGRKFIRGHAKNLEVSMGNNDDYQINDRPWTAQSISGARKEIQKRQKKNLKIFSTQKDGKILKHNFIANEKAKKHTTQSEDFTSSIGNKLSNDLKNIKNRKVKHSEHRHTWKNTLNGMDLKVQKYTQTRKNGESKITLIGGVVKNAVNIDLDEMITKNKNNKQKIINNIVNVLNHVKTDNLFSKETHTHINQGVQYSDLMCIIKEIKEDQHRYSEESENINAKQLLMNGMIQNNTSEDQKRIDYDNETNIYKQSEYISKLVNQYNMTEDQVRNFLLQEQKNSKSSVPLISDNMLRQVINQSSNPNVLSNIELIVRNLNYKMGKNNKNTTEDIKYEDVKESFQRKIGKFRTDNGSKNIDTKLSNTLELKVHNYKSKNLEDTLKLTHNSKDTNVWTKQSESLTLNHTNINPKWNSHTVDECTVGNVNMFGMDAAVPISGYGTAGPKLLRPDNNSVNIQEFT